MCAACNQHFYGRPVFLYKGGCYVITDPLGDTICKKTFNGKCTICNGDQGYFMKDSTCTRCDEFVPGCAVCTPSPDASSAPVCASCKAGKYATADVLPAPTHVHRVAQVAVIKVMSVAVSAVQEPTWMPPQIHVAHAVQPV